MTPAEIAAARALCEAATPGPWHCYHHEGYGWSIDGERVGILSGDWNEADGDLIAAARTLVPALLAALEFARSERDEAIAIADDAVAGVVGTFRRDRVCAHLAALKAKVQP